MLNEDKQLPLISVVVPIYNVENYVTECVKSITGQTYDNLEIILVEDGSPDRCATICDELAEQDKRIKVIHQQNQGVSAARNHGIDAATGEYIAFIDGDDYIDSQMYEKMYETMCREQVDIVNCGMIREKKWDNNTDTEIIEVLYDEGKMASREAVEQLVKVNTAGGCGPCNKLYKKRLFDNIRFPLGVFYEDLRIMYKVYIAAESIYCMHEAYYHYVQRQNSTTHSYVGIDDDQRVQAEYIRANELETYDRNLANYVYRGIANKCISNCKEIKKRYHKETDVYVNTYKIGLQSYHKLMDSEKQGVKCMSWKRKLIYTLFFKK